MSVGPSSPNESDDKLFRQTRDTAKENERGPHGALDETEAARRALSHARHHRGVPDHPRAAPGRAGHRLRGRSEVHQAQGGRQDPPGGAVRFGVSQAAISA